jgi:hypothetical protein
MMLAKHNILIADSKGNVKIEYPVMMEIDVTHPE